MVKAFRFIPHPSSFLLQFNLRQSNHGDSYDCSSAASPGSNQ